MTSLLGCPFCGKVPRGVAVSPTVVVRCSDEHCSVQPFVVGDTRENAVDSWNRRADPRPFPWAELWRLRADAIDHAETCAAWHGIGEVIVEMDRELERARAENAELAEDEPASPGGTGGGGGESRG